MPDRIQLSRRRGYRKPEGAIVVSRPTRWGNPYLVSDVGRRFPSLTLEQCAAYVVNEFRDLLARDDGTYPTAEEIQAELGGHDLACWCPLTDAAGNRVPCHADVLLEISNKGVGNDA